MLIPSSFDPNERPLSSEPHPRPDAALRPVALAFPRDVGAVLNTLLAGMHGALGDNLAGVYLRGSLALGDFDPDTSDVDFFAVTARPVSEAEFAALAALHGQLALTPNPYGDQLEGPYIDCAGVRRFQQGLRYPTIGRGEALSWREHGANWVLERWAVREHGIILLGPDPKTLIDPVTTDELRAAVRVRLRDW